MHPPFLQSLAIVKHALYGWARKLFVRLAVLLLFMAACTSAETYTISGRVSGSWQCVDLASSAASVTITLLPLDREVIFTRTVPEFSFRDVPDGRYTLSVSCSGIAGNEYPGMPVTVSGADVSVEVVLPFPTLPRSTPVATFDDHSQRLSSLAFSGDGSVLVSAAKDGTATQWDLTSGQKLKTFRHGITDPSEPLALSPDGTMLASGSMEGTVKLWNVAAGELRHTWNNLDGPVEGLVFSADGTLLGGWERWPGNQAALWNSTTGNHLRSLDIAQSQQPRGSRRSLAFMQNGAVLVSAVEIDGDWTFQWRDVSTGNRIKSVIAPPATEENMLLLITDLAISPDDSRFALGMLGLENVGGLIIWNVSTGGSTAAAYEWGLTHVEFSPDGAQIASTARDDTVVLWDGFSGEANHVLTGDRDDALNPVTWSGDGQMLAAGSWEGKVISWESP